MNTLVRYTFGIVLLATISSAEVLEMDPNHTEVAFAVQHMTLSLVRGTFNEVNGSLEYRPEDMQVVGGSLTVQVASVDTRIAQRDADLRSAMFFDTEKFPTITFTSTRLVEKDGQATLFGELTMCGVTREISLKTQVHGPIIMDETGHSRIGFEAVATIDRRKWNINYDEKIMGKIPVVGNDVTIRIATEGAVDPPHRGAYR